MIRRVVEDVEHLLALSAPLLMISCRQSEDRGMSINHIVTRMVVRGTSVGRSPCCVMSSERAVETVLKAACPFVTIARLVR